VIVRVALRRENPWILAQWAFLVTGLLMTGYTAFQVAARYAYQAYENRAFDHAVALRQAALRSGESPRFGSYTGAVVGKIEIPRLHISAIVKEGVDERTLGLAAGHIPTTPLPGQMGNVGVAAHRDSLFRNLKDVRRNDKIALTTLDGEYVYRVVSFQIVLPTDISVLDSSPDERILTLVTCYPFYFVGNAPERFIVRAVQVF